jgi:taurine dioxygenase
MSVTVAPFDGSFGATVTGVDFAGPVAADDVAAVLDAFHAFQVLCFPEQQLSPADEVRLVELFNPVGEPDPGSGPRLAEQPEIVILSNIVEDGEPIGYTQKGGMQWHTDASGYPRPPIASMLYALEAPASGGETYFASGHLAYEMLPAAARERIDGLVARYSWVTLHDWLAADDARITPFTAEERAHFPDVERPLVRVHPVTGRKALYFSVEEIVSIGDLDRAQSRALLDELVDHINAMPPVVYGTTGVPATPSSGTTGACSTPRPITTTRASAGSSTSSTGRTRRSHEHTAVSPSRDRPMDAGPDRPRPGC